MVSQDEILTIAELAAHLKVHPTTIYRLLREGRLPAFRVGAAWRFRHAEIEKWEQTSLAATGGKTPAGKPSKRRKSRK